MSIVIDVYSIDVYNIDVYEKVDYIIRCIYYYNIVLFVIIIVYINRCLDY